MVPNYLGTRLYADQVSSLLFHKREHRYKGKMFNFLFILSDVF